MFRCFNAAVYGRKNDKFPVSLPLWLEDMIKAQGITLDSLKKKQE
jgi:hypothetical protein